MIVGWFSPRPCQTKDLKIDSYLIVCRKGCLTQRKYSMNCYESTNRTQAIAQKVPQNC